MRLGKTSANKQEGVVGFKGRADFTRVNMFHGWEARAFDKKARMFDKTPRVIVC